METINVTILFVQNLGLPSSFVDNFLTIISWKIFPSPCEYRGPTYGEAESLLAFASPEGTPAAPLLVGVWVAREKTWLGAKSRNFWKVT